MRPAQEERKPAARRAFTGAKQTERRKYATDDIAAVGISATPDSRTDVAQRQRQADAVAKLNAPIEPTSAEKRAALLAIRDAHVGSDSATQERRLHAALEAGPVTTFEAGRLLDCYHPPARIMGLRKKGVDIMTTWVRQATEAGKVHRIGQYTLIRGKAA